MPVGVGRPEWEAFFLQGLDRQPYALIAYENVRTGEDLLDLVLRFSAERAMHKFGGSVL